MTTAQKVDPGAPLQEGEFRRIKGIAEATERALHSAGIETFDQLAMLTPEEIAAVLPGHVGIKERSARQDWKGQAEQLARELAASKPAQSEKAARRQKEPVEQPPQQHYESFMVVLLVDEEQNVRRTTVTHVKDDLRESWAGWEPQRVTGWIAEQAGISNAKANDSPQPAGKKALPAARKRSADALEGALRFGPLEIAPQARLEPPAREMAYPRIAPEEPFSVRLTLDLSQVEAPAEKRLQVHAAAQVHNLRSWGKAQEIHLDEAAHAGETIPISFALPGLPHGAYHLEIAVLVAPEGSASPAEEGLGAMSEGMMLHVGEPEMAFAAR